MATLTACGAEAQQPTTPEPTPQANQIEPEKPELPADPTPEPLADVKSATEPEPVADVEPEPEPENTLDFIDCNEIVYATDTVNLRSGPSTDYEKVGSLKTAESATRTGIGIDQFENWSRVVLSDGTEVYVNNNYISTTKPVIQQSTSKPSGGGGTATKPSSQSSGASSGSTSGGGTSGGGASGGSSEDANRRIAEEAGMGLAGLIAADNGADFSGIGNISDPTTAVH